MLRLRLSIVHAFAVVALTFPIPALAAKAVRAKNCIRPLQILGQVQIKYVDSDGAHVIYLDSRDYFIDDLPADAEIQVLDADAQFECGGARINAISGTIFSGAEAKGREYLYVRQGELTVEFDGKLLVLDKERHSLSFPKSHRQVESSGFLR